MKLMFMVPPVVLHVGACAEVLSPWSPAALSMGVCVNMQELLLVWFCLQSASSTILIFPQL